MLFCATFFAPSASPKYLVLTRREAASKACPECAEGNAPEAQGGRGLGRFSDRPSSPGLCGGRCASLQKMRPLGPTSRAFRHEIPGEIPELRPNRGKTSRGRSSRRGRDRKGRLSARPRAFAISFVAPMRPKTAKTKRFVSPSETNRFASGSQVIEIIERAESAISRNRLFSMTWPSFRFAIFIACAFSDSKIPNPARERPNSIQHPAK